MCVVVRVDLVASAQPSVLGHGPSGLLSLVPRLGTKHEGRRRGRVFVVAVLVLWLMMDSLRGALFVFCVAGGRSTI